MKLTAKEGIRVLPQMWAISPDLARNALVTRNKIPEVLALGGKYKDFGRKLLQNNSKEVFCSD